MALDDATGGYWLVTSSGAVYGEDAPDLGSASGTVVSSPIVAIAATPEGTGYWLAAQDGRRLRLRYDLTTLSSREAPRFGGGSHRRGPVRGGLLARDSSRRRRARRQRRLLRPCARRGPLRAHNGLQRAVEPACSSGRSTPAQRR